MDPCFQVSRVNSTTRKAETVAIGKENKDYVHVSLPFAFAETSKYHAWPEYVYAGIHLAFGLGKMSSISEQIKQVN